MGKKTPVWFMRQAGRYLPEYREVRGKFDDFLSLCFHVEAASQVTLQPIQRFPELSAAIVFSDILVIPHALGQTVQFSEGGPKLFPIPDIAFLTSAEGVVSSGEMKNRLTPVYSVVREVRKSLPNEKNLIGFSGAPWTLASYMLGGGTQRMGSNPSKVFCYDHRSIFERLIRLLTCCVILHLKEQIRSGADCIQIFDSFSDRLPDDEWLLFCLEPVRNIISSVKEEYPAVPIIVFSKSISPIIRRYVSDTKVDVISIETAFPLEYARDELQTQVAVQGNLDPDLLVCGGPILERRVEHIMRTLASGPFIFNLGHGILPQTPVSHVHGVLERVTNWG